MAVHLKEGSSSFMCMFTISYDAEHENIFQQSKISISVCIFNKSCLKLWQQTFETSYEHLQLTWKSMKFHQLLQISWEQRCYK
jgi:hypothetical protein